MEDTAGNPSGAARRTARPAGGGNEFYEPRFDVPASPATVSRYAFLSSQRTGSNYLCRRLCNVKDRFGLPSEYLNPNAIQAMTPRLGADPKALTFGNYLRRVERLRTTADGCFGIKIQPRQVGATQADKNAEVARFMRGFERIILLTRRDKLAQAVSGSIADVTGKWFGDGRSPELDDASLTRMCPDVALKLNRYIDEESRMADIAARTGRPLLHVTYEEILAEPDATFERVLVFLGEPRGIAGVEEGNTAMVPEKPADDTARRLVDRFLSYIRDTGTATREER